MEQATLSLTSRPTAEHLADMSRRLQTLPKYKRLSSFKGTSGLFATEAATIPSPHLCRCSSLGPMPSRGHGA